MDIREIKDEIARLENGDTTYSRCQKLAILYACRDGLEVSVPEEVVTNRNVQGYSFASEPTGSEFEMAFRGADFDEALGIVNEHMDVIKTMFRKEYDAIMSRLIEAKRV